MTEGTEHAVFNQTDFDGIEGTYLDQMTRFEETMNKSQKINLLSNLIKMDYDMNKSIIDNFRAK